MATIGLRDLFLAPLTEVDGAEEYGDTVRMAKGIKVDMSVEVAEAFLYADDGVDEIVKEFVKGIIKINVNDLPPAITAQVLGQELGDDGVIYAGENDEPPYFAIGFRAKKSSGGIYRYVWLYKVKFKIPNENYETKGDSINFITPEIEGEFIKRDSDGLWKADYTGSPDDEIASMWFDEVKNKN